MGFFSSKLSWGVFDCLTGNFAPVTVRPFVIGSGPDADLRVDSKGKVFPEHCELDVSDNGDAGLRAVFQKITIKINGEEVEAADLEPEANYIIQAGHQFLVIRGSRKLDQWRESLQADFWQVVDRNGVEMQPMSRDDLAHWARGVDHAASVWVKPVGLEGKNAIIPLLDLVNTAEITAPMDDIRILEDDIIREVADAGEHLCPMCLQRFEDAFWVATHEEMRPDSILKGDSFMRFLPSVSDFTADGRVKDPMGSLCSEIACPHDRLILPYGFLQSKNNIFSIVGDTQSGKSYYLTVLSRKLPETLIKKFGINFVDMDPKGNAKVNEMANTLFSRSGPEQAQLLKTGLEGFMYQDVYRKGRIVKMPRPFIYSASQQGEEKATSVTLYDNAGEHFQPGMDTEDRPGAQHVGAAAGIVFMFDPFNSIEFRQRMDRYCDDPQMNLSINDLHRTMLDEIGQRIRRQRALTPHDSIDTPLAFVVGKYDGWKDVFGGCHFGDPLESMLHSCIVPHGEWVLGREGSGDIELPFGAVSRPHARIKVEKDHMEITDLGSRYGTFVDGYKLPTNIPHPIQPFSNIRLHNMTLRITHSPSPERPQYPYVLTLFKDLDSLNVNVLKANSDRLRSILMDTCPSIVSSAEKLSSNVRYFAVSTFGHTPARVKLNSASDSDGDGDPSGGGVAPDPKQLKPFQVEIPVVWLLSEVVPGLIPKTSLNP